MPVHEPSDTIIAGALARLRAEDERLGGDAEAALNSLTWDEGLQTITQYGLQRFLWYELPRKWMTDLKGMRHLAMALGRLLDLLGLPRYAAICRSPETDAVLEAHERGGREGFAAFRRAEERSGVHPPELPELTAQRLQARVRARLVGRHQAAVADDVRSQDRGQPARHQSDPRRNRRRMIGTKRPAKPASHASAAIAPGTDELVMETGPEGGSPRRPSNRGCMIIQISCRGRSSYDFSTTMRGRSRSDLNLTDP